ncbi:MAG: uroporphyrinogen-III C-methyltransferase [Planctomycetes bacterium]|nr:uroporphyrinogen-III C-methyltransferase [Planctomycetota bacterium]
MTSPIGKVYLVGAGPGDPGLLTLRGAECIRIADVVLYDYLASPQLLAGAPPNAELVCLGRHGHGRLMSQAEISDAMIRHAHAGRSVVRLKGGDPSIFAHLAEELAALEAAGVPYEIVPGITAAQAASSHAGIPLTQRDDASCIAIVTGQESAEKESALDYAALAKFPGTLVFYMGVTTAPVWSHALLDNGKSPATPVAIVRRCSLPDQETHFTTLADVGDVVRRTKLRPPAVIIVGDVARQRDLENWFATRPLFGRTVLVTRPEHQSQDLSNQLRRLGANVLSQPAIEISEPHDWSAVDDVIARLHEFDWIVFSSANGVQHFFNRLFALGHDVRRLGNAKLAAIGPATVAALAEYQLRADVQPDTYRAEALAEALAPKARGRRFFLARASRGREVLAEMLTNSGAIVEQALVYESRDVTAANEDIATTLAAGKIDWTTVTSSAIARSLVGLFGDALHETRLAAISPLTADVLTELGHPPAAIAEVYTAGGLIDAILDAESGKP